MALADEFIISYDAACSFLERNNLLGIIRGHEVQQQGSAIFYFDVEDNDSDRGAAYYLQVSNVQKDPLEKIPVGNYDLLCTKLL